MKKLGILLIILAVGLVCFADYSRMGPIEFITDSMRTDGEGVYIFGDGLEVGMASVGDTEGIKLYFEYGATPDVTGTGRMCHGIDIKMIMDQDWDFTTSPHNATVRGARLQAISEDDVSGKVMGIYSNARVEGTAKTIDGGRTNVGVISVEARTELGTSATITANRVVGLLCFHQNKTGAVLTGEYAAIQIDEPLHGTAGISGDKYGIYFADDHATVNCPYDYAFGFDTGLDLDTVAHYNASFTDTGATAADLDGWISVDIDGHQLYIYCYADKPS